MRPALLLFLSLDEGIRVFESSKGSLKVLAALAPKEEASLASLSGLPERGGFEVGYLAGPGRYAPLRSAASLALGFARARSLPIFGVNTLMALARLYYLSNHCTGTHTLEVELSPSPNRLFFGRYEMKEESCTRIGESGSDSALEGKSHGGGAVAAVSVAKEEKTPHHYSLDENFARAVSECLNRRLGLVEAPLMHFLHAPL